ncbi:hypothetical protein PHYSODRAFT_341781 [Phytophthora sojae]|uniref:Uncharacterized protein n=1 Tax=Phytophthora sojae (strain P6497) TaxID=1094619 RepID=G5AEC6_PHYSP|nr:hypothetical protein PHYSODRAFT_341781 [Phytophthora sojae]EGZ06528.1 hypothetical protein PHYSODRAFT_341781 [Phytophthora sojae]|eukprot:XP_009538425.1 hypothetical protein PHYSODRAFT_341781 [Phytophthora sojae]
MTASTLFAERSNRDGILDKIQVVQDCTACLSASSDGPCIVWNLETFVRTQAMFASTVFRRVLYHPDEREKRGGHQSLNDDGLRRKLVECGRLEEAKACAGTPRGRVLGQVLACAVAFVKDRRLQGLARTYAAFLLVLVPDTRDDAGRGAVAALRPVRSPVVSKYSRQTPESAPESGESDSGWTTFGQAKLLASGKPTLGLGVRYFVDRGARRSPSASKIAAAHGVPM